MYIFIHTYIRYLYFISIYIYILVVDAVGAALGPLPKRTVARMRLLSQRQMQFQGGMKFNMCALHPVFGIGERGTIPTPYATKFQTIISSPASASTGGVGGWVVC